MTAYTEPLKNIIKNYKIHQRLGFNTITAFSFLAFLTSKVMSPLVKFTEDGRQNINIILIHDIEHNIIF